MHFATSFECSGDYQMFCYCPNTLWSLIFKSLVLHIFQSMLRCLKSWAEHKGVYGDVDGFIITKMFYYITYSNA